MTISNGHHQRSSLIFVLCQGPGFLLEQELGEFVVSGACGKRKGRHSIGALTCIDLHDTRVKESLYRCDLAELTGVRESSSAFFVAQLKDIPLGLKDYPDLFIAAAHSGDVQGRLFILVEVINIRTRCYEQL